MPVVGQEWDDLSDIRLRVRLLKATNKLAKEPTSAILTAEEENKIEGELQIYKDFMDRWPKPDWPQK